MAAALLCAFSDTAARLRGNEGNRRMLRVPRDDWAREHLEGLGRPVSSASAPSAAAAPKRLGTGIANSSTR
eukprot:13296737-Alexandrium_andersonii.AAC.1